MMNDEYDNFMEALEKATRGSEMISYCLWDGNNDSEMKEFLGDSWRGRTVESNNDFLIETLEGERIVSEGHYIMNIRGNYSLHCHPEIFFSEYNLIRQLLIDESMAEGE